MRGVLIQVALVQNILIPLWKEDGTHAEAQESKMRRWGGRWGASVCYLPPNYSTVQCSALFNPQCRREHEQERERQGKHRAGGVLQEGEVLWYNQSVNSPKP